MEKLVLHYCGFVKGKQTGQTKLHDQKKIKWNSTPIFYVLGEVNIIIVANLYWVVQHPNSSKDME